MSDSLSRTLRIVLALLLAISVGLTFWFYFASRSIDSGLDAEVKIEQYGAVLEYFIGWSYVLLAVAGGSALVFALISIFTNTKNLGSTLIPVVALVVIVAVSYFLASDQLLHMPNYDGTGNEPGTLKMAGMSLITTYFLFAAALASIVIAELSKIFK